MRGSLNSFAAILLAGTAGFICTLSARAQHTTGDWDFSPWDYNGTSILTTVVDSTGPKTVGISMTSESGIPLALVGAPNGAVYTDQPFLLPAGGSVSETIEQAFLLDKPVTFTPLSTESQFNTHPEGDNGVGVAIDVGAHEFVTSCKLTLAVIGGGTFKSVDGIYPDVPLITFVDNRTLTLEWTTLSAGHIAVDRLRIAGSITSFTARLELSWFNGAVDDVEGTTLVTMKINTAPPFSPVVKTMGKKHKFTHGRKARFRGRVVDINDDLVRVEYRVAGRGGFHKARGLHRWKFVARGLKKGRNRILVRAVDSTGSRSRPDRLTVFCRR